MPSFRPANHRFHWTLGLLSLLAMFWMVRSQVMVLDRNVRRDGLSSQVFVAARSVLIDVLDVETGLRGYLIAGREEYLRPYHEGLGRYSDDMARLRARVGDDLEESPQVAEVARLGVTLLREFADQVTLSGESGIEAARARFQANPTKPQMDEIRAHLSILQAEEQARLDDHRRDLDARLDTALWLLDASMVLVVIVTLCLATGFIRPATSP